jgi:putative inorganic carbon (HCO3(-)) transporter
VNSSLTGSAATAPPGALAQRHSVPRVPPVLIGALGVLAALTTGRFLASGSFGLGVAVVLAAVYIPLVFVDLALAIALWAGLLYLRSLSVVSVGPTLIEILLVVGWLGIVATRRVRLRVLQEHRLLVAAIVLCGCWLTVSVAWAEEPGKAAASAGYWWMAILAFAVVATTIRRPRDVRIVALAFVIGAVIAVAIGFLGIGGQSAALKTREAGTRLVAAGGDPNYQAAGFLAAMFVAGGLIGVVKRPAARTLLPVALGFITLGFVATESRGGVLGLAFALVAAFLLLRHQRARVLAWTLIAAAGLAVYLPFHHDALHRLTHFGGGGSGREDQWTVAWRIFRAHPLFGVGLGNFTVLEPRYTLEPGPMTHVAIIAETPDIVHNTYLQLLAETGVIGLIVFLIVVAGSLRASWLAAKRFDAVGREDYGDLARAVLIGTIGMLAASFFLTNGNNFELWILFALGPAMLTLAKGWHAERPLASRLHGPSPVRSLPRKVTTDRRWS